MIEHVNYDAGRIVAAQAYRALNSGGILRVVTPDMRIVQDLLEGKLGRYAQWSNSKESHEQGGNPVFTVNRMMREWGHTFIYDEKTLTELLLSAGFVDVVRTSPGESNFPHLRGVERHGETIGHEWNLIESMVLEARK